MNEIAVPPSAMTNADYHAHPAIGASGLKLLARSPLHYWAAYIDPDRSDREQTAAQKLGSATHAGVLEPGVFDDTYVVLPEGLDRRTTAGKTLYAEIVATGKTPLSAKEWAATSSMIASIQRHPVMRALMASSPKFEHTIMWADGKARPDLMIEPCADYPTGVIVDIKTCQDASPEGFGRNAWNADMEIQAAWYTLGFQTVYALSDRPPFVWLAVESKPPYACAFYTAPVALIEHGQREIDRLLPIYRQCVASGKWPGYQTTVTDLVLPQYATRTLEEPQQ